MTSAVNVRYLYHTHKNIVVHEDETSNSRSPLQAGGSWLLLAGHTWTCWCNRPLQMCWTMESLGQGPSSTPDSTALMVAPGTLPEQWGRLASSHIPTQPSQPADLSRTSYVILSTHTDQRRRPKHMFVDSETLLERNINWNMKTSAWHYTWVRA